MISSINCCNPKPHFCGTTIIKKEGGDFLTREIIEASNMSRPGFINTRLDGYSIVTVSNIFAKAENNFLKSLREKNIPHAYFSKVLNHKLFSIEELKQLIKKIAELNLI